MRLVRSLALAVATALAAGAGCDTDPVHSAEVASLGPEAPNIPVGQYHRAGQPCGVCHGPEGPASTQFAIAGTIFYGPGTTSAPVGVAGVTVYLEDDSSSQQQVTTNCVGNFFIGTGVWTPQFPVLVTVGGSPNGMYDQVSMQSLIGRSNGCGECHLYPTTANYFETPGLIHLVSQDDSTFKGDSTCPVQPPVPVGLGGLQ
jgi:hypothetical protein